MIKAFECLLDPENQPVSLFVHPSGKLRLGLDSDTKQLSQACQIHIQHSAQPLQDITTWFIFAIPYIPRRE